MNKPYKKRMKKSCHINIEKMMKCSDSGMKKGKHVRKI